jgi:hypothetical protein
MHIWRFIMAVSEQVLAKLRKIVGDADHHFGEGV